MSFNNFVFKELTYFSHRKKFFFYSVLIALIMTIFTPHLYIESEYWNSKIFLPHYSPVYLILETDKIDNDDNVYNAVSILNFRNINKNVELKKSINGKVSVLYKYDFVIYPTYKVYNSINFKSNIEGKARLLFDDNFFINSLQINGEECLKKIKNSSSSNKYYYFNVSKNENFNVKIKAKQTPKNAESLMNNFNVFAFFLLFSFYLFSSFFVLQNREIIILFINSHKKDCFIFVMLILLYFSYSFKMLSGIDYFLYDLFSSADTNVVVNQICCSSVRRYHPYFFYPFYFLFDVFFVITKNLTVSLSLIYSLINTLTILFIYKSLNYVLSKNLNILLTLIFMFSNIMLFYGFVIEVYPITSLYLSLLLYIVLNYLKRKKVTCKNIIFFSLITALTFGVSIVNIITALIIIGGSLFFISKKACLKYLILSFLFIGFFIFSNSLVNNFQSLHAINPVKHKNEIVKYINKSNHNEFAIQTLYKPLLPIKFLIKPFWIIFTLMIIGSFLINHKNKIKKENKVIFTLLICALLCNLISSYIWDSKEAFIFVPNHFVLWFIIFAFCLNFFEINNKLIKTILILFLIIEIPTNMLVNLNLRHIALKKSPLIENIRRL